MTNRELIDLKVSSHQPNKTQTFQVLMYYLMHTIVANRSFEQFSI